MSFGVEVFARDAWPPEAARRVALSVPARRSLVLTGGDAARRLYAELAVQGGGWSDLDVYFSDERCVPPDHDDSNYGMAAKELGALLSAATVHRMRGEDEPAAAAAAYAAEVTPAAEARFDLMLLGMGRDGHVAALFPEGPGISEEEAMCIAVDRPDGLRGLSLTPPALRSAREILLIVTGQEKADAVRRAVAGDEPPARCPARLLAEHPNATFLLDDAAARHL